MSMQSGLYRKYLPDLVRSGEVPEATARPVRAPRPRAEGDARPVRRSLPPHRREARSCALDASERRARSLARPGASRSSCSRTTATCLPLPRSGKRIALIGPFAAGSTTSSDRGWSMATTPRRSTSPRAFAAAVADRSFSHRRARFRRRSSRSPAGSSRPSPRRARRTSSCSRSANSQGMSGEAQSRTEIVVPAPQQELAEAVAAIGKPVVVVLKHGRALALEGAVAERPGDPRDLVPRNRDRQRHRRRAVRRLQPFWPPARRASRGSRAKSLIITRTSLPAGRIRRASCSPTRRISAVFRTAPAIPSATA